MQCSFCTDVTLTGEILYEDSHCWIVLHPDHAVPGHVMLVARRHVENASELPEDEWLHLARIWHRAERILLEATETPRSILLKLGIQTPHFHVHLYPMAADASREEVFAAFERAAQDTNDQALVAELRRRLGDIGPAHGA